MISNERPSAHHRGSPFQGRPAAQETTLRSGHVEAGQTDFLFTLKANARGRFLRITEKTIESHVCIIIPDTGLERFQQALETMFQAANEPSSTASPDARHILTTEQVQVERKDFTFELVQESGERFLCIIEKAGGRSNDLHIPAGVLEAFRNLMAEMVKAADGQSVTAPAGTGTPIMEQTLKTGQMQLERRSVTFVLKKNQHGRFLRIATEEREGRYNTILIPAAGLEEFKKWVVEMAKASKKLKE